MNKTVWLATSVSTVLFVIVGWLGALAFALPPDGSVNILQAIESNGFVPPYMCRLHVCTCSSTGFLHIVSQICVYLFPAVVLLSGIPVASIIIRYNLIQSGLCGKGAPKRCSPIDSHTRQHSQTFGRCSSLGSSPPSSTPAAAFRISV